MRLFVCLQRLPTDERVAAVAGAVAAAMGGPVPYAEYATFGTDYEIARCKAAAKSNVVRAPRLPPFPRTHAHTHTHTHAHRPHRHYARTPTHGGSGGARQVPVGELGKGTAEHRAFAFKFVADRCGLDCSLVRSHGTTKHAR